MPHRKLTLLALYMMLTLGLPSFAHCETKGTNGLKHNHNNLVNPKQAKSAQDPWKLLAMFYSGGPEHGIGSSIKKNFTVTHARPLLLGYASDGIPIYAPTGFPSKHGGRLRSSYRIKYGPRQVSSAGMVSGGYHDGTFVQDYEYVKGLGDLDERNGKYAVTHEYPRGTYLYVVTDTYPYMPRPIRNMQDQSGMRHAQSRPAAEVNPPSSETWISPGFGQRKMGPPPGFDRAGMGPSHGEFGPPDGMHPPPDGMGPPPGSGPGGMGTPGWERY